MSADEYLVLLPRNNMDWKYVEAAPRARMAPAPSEVDILYRLNMKRLRKCLDPALTMDEPRGVSLKRSASEDTEPTDSEVTTRGSVGHGSRQGLVVLSNLPALPTSHEALRWISYEDRDDLIASFIPKATPVPANNPLDDNVPGQNLHEHRRAVKQNKPLRMRIGHPVAVSTPMDVWRVLLQSCDPVFLLKARRVSRSFSSILECDKIWEEARLRIYGPDCPGPPANLTEWQYADLLTGVGCQAKNCVDKRAKRVYWIMQRRWCEKCWQKRTLTAQAVRIITRDYAKVSTFVPCFSYNRSKKHHFIGWRATAPDWVRDPTYELGYERRAIRDVMSEIDGLLGKTQDEKDEWSRLRELETRRLQQELKIVEHFFETRKRVIRREERGLEEARKTFFEEKAILMHPPMRPEVLRLTSAFHRAIAIRSKPTESAWQALSVRVKEERREAEILASIDAIASEASKEEFEILQDRINEQDQRKHELRSNPRQSSNLSLVLRVAELVMNSYLGVTKTTSNDVADEDLIPLVLKEFYACWYQLGEGQELDGKPIIGYDLILDDARVIVEHVIEPVIQAWESVDRQWTARYLKCPACRNLKQRWTFEHLMHHIIHYHTKTVGAFSSWRPTPNLECNDFYRIRWPANLPVLADHQEATGHWDLETLTEHHRLSVPIVKIEKSRPDAFAFRYASSYIGPHYHEFVENIIFAADAVKNLDCLSNGLKTLMVLKYADMKYPATNTDRPSDVHFFDMQTELVRHGYEELFEDFMCEYCVVYHRSANTNFATHPNRCVTRGQSLGDMVTHYCSTHRGQVWTKGLFLLPSSEDLSKALAEDREAAAVFDRLFPLNVSLGMQFLSKNALIIEDGAV